MCAKNRKLQLYRCERTFLFLPPFDYRYLSKNRKKQVEWLKRFFHGFSWNCGIHSYDELHSILNSIVTEGEYVYTKGAEKQRLIENMLDYNKSVEVIDLEVLKCPSLSVLQQQTVARVDCPYKHNLDHCALNNVFHIANWILNNKI